MKKGTLYIYGLIGTGKGETSHQSVVDALARMGDVDEIDVRINSRGGSVYQATGIYAALNDHPARKIAHIDGIAFSSGSLVPMACDEIHIAESGMMMVHMPSSEFRGTAKKVRQDTEMLDQLGEQMVGAYAARTGLPREEIISMMDAQTFLRASEAVSKGFATKLVPNKAVAALADLSEFENVPDWVRAEFPAGDPQPPMEAVMSEVIPVAESTETPPVITPEPTAKAPDIDALVREGVEKGLREGRRRDAEIRAICKRAGHPEAAEAFIDEPTMTASDVQAKMFDQLCRDNVPVGGAEVTAADVTAPDPDAKWIAEYEANKDTITGVMGVSKEAYIASRKADLA